MLHKHNKTGNMYRLIATATDCTNSRDGTPVVIYVRVGGTHIYVREKEEFLSKFTSVVDVDYE